MFDNHKKNSILTIVIILDLVITVLCLFLGAIMYTSNSKTILQNNTYVEITGLITNIEYGLHFGKSVESYYGMETELEEAVRDSEHVDSMYVVSDESGLLFGTDKQTLPGDVSSLASSSNISHGDHLYCVFELTENSRIITESDISGDIDRWRAYYGHLALFAFGGFLVTAALIVIIWRFLKKKQTGYRIMITVLILWICVLSSYVGYCAYIDYSDSISGLNESVIHSINNDLDSVHELGIKDQNISGMDEYLSRYTLNINEIEKITQQGDGFEVVTSSSYMRRVAVDYILQTLLLLIFVAMILAEYHIFASAKGWEETEDDDADA